MADKNTEQASDKDSDKDKKPEPEKKPPQRGRTFGGRGVEKRG